MKPTGFILLLLAFFNQAFAQETVALQPKKLQQLYLSFGLGGAITQARHTTGGGANSVLMLTATFRNDQLFRAGLLGFVSADDQPASRQWKADRHQINLVPNHAVASQFVAFGKRKSFSGGCQVQALVGLSYNVYSEPADVFQTYADLGFFGRYAVLDYTLKQHRKPGLLLNVEGMVLPLRFAGLTLGGYYHYIPKISNGGFTLSLNLGRIRTKEIAL